jgi:hypothetical protein
VAEPQDKSKPTTEATDRQCVSRRSGFALLIGPRNGSDRRFTFCLAGSMKSIWLQPNVRHCQAFFRHITSLPTLSGKLSPHGRNELRCFVSTAHSYCSFRQCVSRKFGFALLSGSRSGSHPTHLDCVEERENASDFFCGCQVESGEAHAANGVWGALAWWGMTPDGSPLIVHGVGTEEIYALDVDFP